VEGLTQSRKESRLAIERTERVAPGGFFPVLQWQWAISDLRDVPHALRFVAWAQSTFADARTGESHPSLDDLETLTGYGQAWIKRMRAELVKLGYLALVKKGDGRGRGNASVYRLAFPAGETGYSRAAKPATETGYSGSDKPATPSSHQVKPEVVGATAFSSSPQVKDPSSRREAFVLGFAQTTPGEAPSLSDLTTDADDDCYC
jgi:hypothetical protein